MLSLPVDSARNGLSTISTATPQDGISYFVKYFGQKTNIDSDRYTCPELFPAYAKSVLDRFIKVHI